MARSQLQRLVVRTAALVMLLPSVAVAAEQHPQVKINFQQARREIRHFTAMTCTEPCRHRAYGCHRHSTSRVSCRSWILIRREGVVYPENEFVIERETCKWVTVATPYRGSSTKLRLDSKHYRCWLEKTDKEGNPLPSNP